MSFTGVNYLAVIIATLAGFGLGPVWYAVLAKPWMRAAGKTEVYRPQSGAHQQARR